jgi:TBC1 domain family member 8/9
MSTISTQLRNFKEPTREQLNLLFFSLPLDVESRSNASEKGSSNDLEKIEVGVIMSLGLEGVEESYVCCHALCIKDKLFTVQQTGRLYLIPPYLAFTSLDRKSVRFTMPLSTIRRVERLNAKAGVYALSLSLWHGMKIVSAICM